MRKLLLFLLLIPTWCAAQNGQYIDFWRTPKWNNVTVGDGQLKAWYFNLPHYSHITRRHGQDSIGTIFLSTDDQHIYIKKQVGSIYYPLAFLSDLDTVKYLPLQFHTNKTITENGFGLNIKQNGPIAGITISATEILDGRASIDYISSKGTSTDIEVGVNSGGTNFKWAIRNKITGVLDLPLWIDTRDNSLHFPMVTDTVSATKTLVINTTTGRIYTANYTGGSVVNSIFGRNGNVIAQNGDYNTSQVTENTNLYFTQPRVLATPATGFSPSAGVISSTDPLITVLNKLQGNITASVTGVSSFNTRGGAVVPVAGDYASLTETLTNKNLTSVTNTFPTFNQNTTGTAASAATLTTPRTINGVSFNGSANITITANNPNSLLNGFGILGGSYNGGSAITLRADTNAGKLATQWKIDSTANAHGAVAGYGINPTLFGTGTVAVDTTNVASKSWGMAAFYTKAQVQSTALNFTALHTHTFNSIGTATTDAELYTNTTVATNVLNQYSPSIHFSSPYWTGSASAASDFIIHDEAGLLVFKGALNGGSYNNLGFFSVTAGGGSQLTLPASLNMTQGFNAATRTDGIIMRNPAASSSGNPNQSSSSFILGGSVWNTSGTPAANYFNFDLHASGNSSGTPTAELDIMSSLQTTTTPSYTKIVSIDNAGNAATKSVRGTAVTFANLPATPVEGMMVPVTDSSVNTWGTTITGGGANHVLAYYNGTNWTVAAK